MQTPYYTAYEKRYQAVYSAGAERWGHSPDDEILYNTLKIWVEENGLKGKKVIEYACGEGACGVILSELGCFYHGVDIAPSAIEKSNKLLEKYPDAKCEVLDMVKECVNEKYDAALDCMGLHMLITDSDRKSYLQNVFKSLNIGAPMLLFRESYRKDGVYRGIVNSIEEWLQITGDDYNTPHLRQVHNVKDDKNIEVFIPFVPARARDKKGYVEELEGAGFDVEQFVEMDASASIVLSASIYIRKTTENDSSKSNMTNS